MNAKQKLQRLHELMAELMLEELEAYREMNAAGEFLPVPAADKSAIIKFLKDNGVTVDPTDQADLEKLREALNPGKASKATPLQERVAKLSMDDMAALYDTQLQ